MMRWLSMAVCRDIVLRSLKICAVVGTIGHGLALFV